MALSGDVKVGERMFRIQKIPAMESQRGLNRFLGIVTPAVAASLGNGVPRNFAEFLSGAANLERGTHTFFEKFNDAEQDRLFKEQFAHVRVRMENGEWLELWPIVNDIFTGHLAEMFRLLGECIKFQWADFFGALMSAVSADETSQAGKA